MQYAKKFRWLKRNSLLLALMQSLSAHAQGADAAHSAPFPLSEGADSGSSISSVPSVEQSALKKTTRQVSGSATEAAELATVTVTAEKKTENIQKVPIAITAFSGEELINRHIETGADLVTATPNVSFSKTNFASYNFQIRGIGTQALSVTTDPAVAISFNDSPMIRNRLFEQEYFDVSNVQVLRGPQGTLFGRNATAGVVNMIPNLPNLDGFESWVKVETGNYDTERFSGMVNVPISDTLAFRAAGAWTDRSGYIKNTVTDKNVDGRNLWSSRLSLAWKPSDGVNANIIWEHFDEHDNRARTGKQLCHTDSGPGSIGGITLRPNDRNYFSQGCADGSLYDQGAFGVPNGGSLPYVLALAGPPGIIGLVPRTGAAGYTQGYAIPSGGFNPYAGVVQSTDLRQIATTYDPVFRAKNDVVQLNFDADLGSDLKFVSQTLFTRDRYYSSQDYGRFQSNPLFNSTSSGVFAQTTTGGVGGPAYDSLPNGVFCDPQLGCSNRLLAVDLVQSYSSQWSQEFRLQSSFDGPFNFNLGANGLYYKVDESYYVFSNAFTFLAQNYFNSLLQSTVGGPPVNCSPGQTKPTVNDASSCVYIDPNTFDKINGQGHNYFRSRNIARTISVAAFGETYWQLNDTVKLTAGLRVTDDRKITTPVPSQLLLAPGYIGGGYVNSGYPVRPNIYQEWAVPTGRLVLDWTPHLSFTDSTLVYASYSRGYKAGGTNSPGIGADPEILPFIQRNSEFKPEYVNSFEIGTKNVIAGGKLTFNATFFYNDYKNYQVSQIQDRATLNENFNAKTWGAELEAAWRPVREFQISGNLGLLGTKVGPNQFSIDVMNRTQGNPDWVLIRPWIQLASNCIAPKALVEKVLQKAYLNPTGSANTRLSAFCPGGNPLTGGGFLPGQLLSGIYGFTYDPSVDAPNGGQGFSANIGGHSLPNAPHLTVSISPQYTFFTSNGNWTVRADLYYQSESWARVYQDPIDRLHDWGNVNLSLTYERSETDLTVQLYVKNALNGKAITGTFLNSDDTGLTANAFLQDPRIIGLSVRKGFY